MFLLAAKMSLQQILFFNTVISAEDELIPATLLFLKS